MTDDWNVLFMLQILKSLWSLLSANVTVGLTLMTSLMSVVFSGGTLLLNFVRYRIPFKYYYFHFVYCIGYIHNDVILLVMLLRRPVSAHQLDP